MSESQPLHRRNEPGLFEPLLKDITKKEIHLNPAFHDRRTLQRRSTDGLEHILASINLHLHAGTRMQATYNASRFNSSNGFSSHAVPTRGRARTYSRSKSMHFSTFEPTTLSTSTTLNYNAPESSSSKPDAEPKEKESKTGLSESMPTPLIDLSAQVGEALTLLTSKKCTSTLPYYGGTVKISTTASPFYVKVWLICVRSGGPPTWIRIPRFYQQHYSHYSVDVVRGRLVIEWAIESEDGPVEEDSTQKTLYRIDFSEDSSTDSDSEPEGWITVAKNRKNSLGKATQSAARELSFMPDGERLEAFTKEEKKPSLEEKKSSKQSLQHLTKEEKKVIKRSLQMTTTKEIAAAVKEVKKKEKQLKMDKIKSSKSYSDLHDLQLAEASTSLQASRLCLTRTATDVPVLQKEESSNHIISSKHAKKQERKPLFRRAASAVDIRYQMSSSKEMFEETPKKKTEPSKKEGKKPMFSRKPTAIYLPHSDTENGLEPEDKSGRGQVEQQKTLSDIHSPILFLGTGGGSQERANDSDYGALTDGTIIAAPPSVHRKGKVSKKDKSASRKKSKPAKLRFDTSHKGTSERPFKSARFRLSGRRDRKSSISAQPLLQKKEDDVSKVTFGSSSNEIDTVSIREDSTLTPDKADIQFGMYGSSSKEVALPAASGENVGARNSGNAEEQDWVVVAPEGTPKKKKTGLTRRMGQMRRSFSTYF